MIQILRHQDIPKGLDPMGENIAFNETSFKVWVPSHTGVVLGNSQKPEIELNLNQIQENQIPVYKRKGGGGTVLLSPDGLCYAVKFKKSKDLAIHDYFEMGTSILQNVLFKHFGIESSMRGISDLAVDDRKILGCSLYLPKTFALFYASILVKDESKNIEKYLAHPSREPDYRKGRSHSDFITSLDQLIEVKNNLQQSILSLITEEINSEWKDSLSSDFLSKL